MPSLKILLLFAVMAVTSSPVALHAWADGGHKAVALLTWNRLGEAERAWVVSLLRAHPLWEEHFGNPMQEELGDSPDVAAQQKWLFAQAAVWPDIIRGPRSGGNPWIKWHRPTWHYIDYPVFASEAARLSLESVARPGPMEWQPGRAAFLESKLNAVQVLKKAMHEIAQPDIPAPDRAVMLCWLFHLVGDIHQPCHCGTLFDQAKLPTGDRGGNGTTIIGLPDKPLHAFWDNLLGAPEVNLADSGQVTESLELNAALVGHAEAATRNLNPEAWARESNEAARVHVYPMPVLVALTTAKRSTYSKGEKTFASVTLQLGEADLVTYRKNAHLVASQRVMIAGFRLAEVLRQCASKRSE